MLSAVACSAIMQGCRSRSTARSATRSARRSRSAARTRARRSASSSSGTPRGACTTTSGSSATACSLSWAVPKGVPLALGERHLAVHVEDHPLDYGDFEGEIPAGQYGAGTVEIWDRGTYELVEEKKDGGLTVRLHGNRLEGLWTLVPAHLDGKEKNWLLLRKDGSSEARTYAPMLATRHRRPADRRGLGVRAEVGRLQGAGDGRRRRRHLPEPERQRPHDPLRERRPGPRPRRALAVGGARRRGLRPRRDRPLGVRAAAAGRGHARLRRLRRARAGRRAARRPAVLGAARGARAARRHLGRGRARLAVVRRRRRARAGRARARARGGRREAGRLALPAGPPLDASGAS